MRLEISDSELRDLITNVVVRSTYGRTLVYVLTKREIVRDDTLPFPAGVGKEKMWVNVKKLKELAHQLNVDGEELLAQIVMHECLHVAMGHFERLPSNMMANWAEDATINRNLPLLYRKPFVTHDWLKQFNKEVQEEDSAEEIFMKLQKNIKINEDCPSCGGKGKKGRCTGKKGKGEEGESEGSERGEGDRQTVDDHEKLRDEFKNSPLEKERIKEDLKKGIKSEMNKSAGKLPGELSRILDLLEKLPAKWKEVLKNVIGTLPSTADNSYARVNRRNDDDEIVIPGKKKKESKIGVAILFDTSGSLFDNDKFYGRVIRRIKEMISQELIEVKFFIEFDVNFKVIKDWEVKHKVELAGGGGTDIVPAITWLKGNEKEIDLIIGVTDGYWGQEVTKWPKPKIVWLCDNEEEKKVLERMKRSDHRVIVFDEK